MDFVYIAILAAVVACVWGVVVARRYWPAMRFRGDRVLIALFLIPVLLFCLTGLLVAAWVSLWGGAEVWGR